MSWGNNTSLRVTLPFRLRICVGGRKGPFSRRDVYCNRGSDVNPVASNHLCDTCFVSCWTTTLQARLDFTMRVCPSPHPCYGCWLLQYLFCWFKVTHEFMDVADHRSLFPSCSHNSKTAHQMKALLLITLATEFIAGCSPAHAPVMKRMGSSVLLDERYLTNVFAPAVEDKAARLALSNSISQLREHLAEFRVFMGHVEVGKIPVAENMKGGWQSYESTAQYSTYAGYFNQLGPVSQFDRRENHNPYPLVYGFSFYTNGFLNWADTIEDGFQFDEHGRVLAYWHKTTNYEQDLHMGDDGKVQFDMRRSDVVTDQVFSRADSSH